MDMTPQHSCSREDDDTHSYESSLEEPYEGGHEYKNLLGGRAGPTPSASTDATTDATTDANTEASTEASTSCRAPMIRYDPMKSFLHLETTPSSTTSSLDLDDNAAFSSADDNDASFLHSSRTSTHSVATPAPEHRMPSDAIFVPGAVGFADGNRDSSPTSAMTVARPVTSTARKAGAVHRQISMRSLDRHASQRRFPDRSEDDGAARRRGPASSHRRRQCQNGRLFDRHVGRDQDRQPSVSSNHQGHRLRASTRSGSPVQSPRHVQQRYPCCTDRRSPPAASTSFDALSSPRAMTRDEFEALPPTIQRKVRSTCVTQNPVLLVILASGEAEGKEARRGEARASAIGPRCGHARPSIWTDVETGVHRRQPRSCTGLDRPRLVAVYPFNV
ncbi:hypothetical protein RJ55_02488 [Drechmeria coniospora]|nr:hypothetical protein RJ55_02488 [Drechmeria coniospora]